MKQIETTTSKLTSILKTAKVSKVSTEAPYEWRVQILIPFFGPQAGIEKSGVEDTYEKALEASRMA